MRHESQDFAVDFIPIVPWLAPYLAGMAFAKAVPPAKLEPSWPDFVQAARLAWPGQHSLTFYLVHQPVLVAMVWLISLVFFLKSNAVADVD